jgi:hypothetical protein
MPPIMEGPASEVIGNGLQSLSEDEDKQNDMTTHYVDIKIDELIDHQHRLTPRGQWIAEMIAKQLKGLPVHCSLQVSTSATHQRATAFALNLFDQQRVRPGLVAVSLIGSTLPNDSLRILIERYNVPTD